MVMIYPDGTPILDWCPEHETSEMVFDHFEDTQISGPFTEDLFDVVELECGYRYITRIKTIPLGY